MRRKTCLPGDIFGKWTVIKDVEPRISICNGKEVKRRVVLCRCECGSEREVEAGSLRQRKSLQCKVCRYSPNYLIGKKFDSLFVSEYIGRSASNKYVYKCICDCGNIKEILGASLLNGRTKTCGHKKFGSENHNWRGFEEIPGRYIYSLRTNAEKRSLEFSISLEDIWKKYLEQDMICALTGIKISFLENAENKASVDRINSSIGYTPDNIQIVHLDINRMKYNFSQEKFMKLCKLVVENR